MFHKLSLILETNWTFELYSQNKQIAIRSGSTTTVYDRHRD